MALGAFGAVWLTSSNFGRSGAGGGQCQDWCLVIRVVAFSLCSFLPGSHCLCLCVGVGERLTVALWQCLCCLGRVRYVSPDGVGLCSALRLPMFVCLFAYCVCVCVCVRLGGGLESHMKEGRQHGSAGSGEGGPPSCCSSCKGAAPPPRPRCINRMGLSPISIGTFYILCNEQTVVSQSVLRGGWGFVVWTLGSAVAASAFSVFFCLRFFFDILRAEVTGRGKAHALCSALRSQAGSRSPPPSLAN